MDSTQWFVQQPDITPSSGKYSLTVKGGYVYSLSTMGGQGRGTALPPRPATLALPYTDNFDGYPVGSEAKYLSNIQGDFQSYNRTDGGGTCMRQMLQDGAPIFFFNPGWGVPFASIGDVDWTDYTVSVDVLFEKATTIYLANRVGWTSGGNFANEDPSYPAKTDCYYVQLTSTGAWTVYDYTYGGSQDNSSQGTRTQKASGSLATAPGLNTWVRLSMTCSGSTISASINGTQVASFTSTTHAKGQVGFGILGWYTAQFSNLCITPAGTLPTGAVFYHSASYTGTAGQPLPAGSYSAAQLAARGMPSSWAASVQIPSGWKVIMYSGDNFTGTIWTLSANTSDFGTLSPSALNAMKSCKVQVDNATTVAVTRKSSWTPQPYLVVTRSSNGFSISLQHAALSSLEIYNLSGKSIARYNGIKDNRVYWDASRRIFPEGLYIIKARLPEGGMLSRTFIFSR
jgi:hypothetical protein